MLQDGRIDVYSLRCSRSRSARRVGRRNGRGAGPGSRHAGLCDGTAFNKKDTELRDAYDAELAKMKKSANSGDHRALWASRLRRPMSTSRDKLCSAK